MVELWPWWLGAAALFATSIGFVLAVGRPLGVSGAVATLLDRDELRAERSDAAALEDEMMRATREAFGDDAIAAAATTTAAGVGARKLSWSTNLAFALGIVGGGFVAALSTGAVGLPLDDAQRAFFGDGVGAYAIVFAGAVLVGFGTQLAGGCTSGHGLVGCARLQPGSLVGTAVFFGTAIAVSFLLAAVLR